MLGRVLQNPDALSSIMKIAQGLRNGGDQKTAPPQQSREPQQQVQDEPQDTEQNDREENAQESNDISNVNLLNSFGPQLSRLFKHDENRSHLLVALKPYLGKNRREKVDSILNILQLMELADSSGLIQPRK